MQLARVVGTVVSTRKDPLIEGKKLLIVRLIAPDGDELDEYQVAVDTVDAGFGEIVLMAGGSSARMAEGCQDKPIDRAIIGIVDTVDFLDGLEPPRRGWRATPEGGGGGDKR